MPGKRQPTDLVVANGRKHLSRSEEAERRAGEIRVEPPKTAKAPKWLPKGLRPGDGGGPPQAGQRGGGGLGAHPGAVL